MTKDESRYYLSSTFIDVDKKDPLIKLMKEELKNEGIDNLARKYAKVIQRSIFESYKEKGIYPTLGNCLCRLRYRRCKGICRGLGMVTDHGELWYRDNSPFVYLAQPYSVNKRDIEELNKQCIEHGFDYRIHGDSFHFPSATFVIEIFKDKTNSKIINL